MKIALGPLLYHWPRAQVLDFYARAAECAADTVYLGETVCAKRRELDFDDWQRIAEALEAAGKEAVLSTLTLIEAESELSALARCCRESRFAVEANDMAAVQLLGERQVSFVAGPAINLYSAAAVRLLQQAGMRRWVVPVELPGQELRRILDALAADGLGAAPQVEAFGHGYLPLAYSARCFTARVLDLPKDRCGLRCIEHPQGMPVHTRDGRRLFTINGIQTQSGLVQDLRDRWPQMAQDGVDVFRLSPLGVEMLALVDALAEAIAAQRVPAAAGESCNGYWLGVAGMNRVRGA